MAALGISSSSEASSYVSVLVETETKRTISHEKLQAVLEWLISKVNEKDTPQGPSLEDFNALKEQMKDMAPKADVDALKEKVDAMGKEQAQLKERMDKAESRVQRLTELQEPMLEWAENVDTGMDGLRERMKALEDRMQRLREMQDPQLEWAETIDAALEGLKQAVGTCQDDCDALRDALNSTSSAPVPPVPVRAPSLRMDPTELSDLKTRVRKLENAAGKLPDFEELEKRLGNKVDRDEMEAAMQHEEPAEMPASGDVDPDALAQLSRAVAQQGQKLRQTDASLKGLRDDMDGRLKGLQEAVNDAAAAAREAADIGRRADSAAADAQEGVTALETKKADRRELAGLGGGVGDEALRELKQEVDQATADTRSLAYATLLLAIGDRAHAHVAEEDTREHIRKASERMRGKVQPQAASSFVSVAGAGEAAGDANDDAPAPVAAAEASGGAPSAGGGDGSKGPSAAEGAAPAGGDGAGAGGEGEGEAGPRSGGEAGEKASASESEAKAADETEGLPGVVGSKDEPAEPLVVLYDMLGNGLVREKGDKQALRRLAEWVDDNTVTKGLISHLDGLGPDVLAKLKKLSDEVSRLKKQLKGLKRAEASPPRVGDGDHAMLSAKPLFGYRCMSCDRPLDTIHDHGGSYVPKNGFPTRRGDLVKAQGAGRPLSAVDAPTGGTGGRKGRASASNSPEKTRPTTAAVDDSPPRPARPLSAMVGSDHGRPTNRSPTPGNWFADANGPPGQDLPPGLVGPHLPPGGWRGGDPLPTPPRGASRAGKAPALPKGGSLLSANATKPSSRLIHPASARSGQ